MESTIKKISIIKSFLLYIISLFILVIFTDYLNISEDKALLLSQYLVNIIVISYIIFKSKTNISSLKDKFSNFVRNFNIKETVKILLSQLAFSMGTLLILLGIFFVLSPNTATELFNESNTTSLGNPILMYINLAIITPIFEELLFRKVFFAGLLRKHSFWFSSLLSSAIFGLLHAELAFIGAFAFGLVCCLLYKKSNNILVPISLHVLNNSLTGLPLLLSTATSSDDIVVLTTTDSILYFIVGSILLILSSIFIIRYFRKNKTYIKE